MKAAALAAAPELAATRKSEGIVGSTIYILNLQTVCELFL